MKSVSAVFDGKVFVPTEPVDLPAQSVVTVLVAETDSKKSQREAFEWFRNNPRHGGGADFDRGDLYP